MLRDRSTCDRRERAAVTVQGCDCVDGRGVRAQDARSPIRNAEHACLLLAAWLLSTVGCADYVAPADLLARLEAGTAPPSVDVRSGGEFATSHVPGAVHVPFYAILSEGARLPTPTDAQPIVLYCEHGPRAGIARAQLWLAGVGPVLFLDGHMSGWKEDGHRVERGGQTGASSSLPPPAP